ncbi:MAG: hypothetical protein DMF96_16725 [Acidobacteria bacterium]|nr:MAG: hypothetical protein DMF96_16725 [Acidobacteriota bacterium]
MLEPRRVPPAARPFLTAAILALGSCLATPPDGVAQDSSKSRLAGVKTLKCAFALYATGTWNNGEARAEVKPASLSVSFDEIDIDSGTARVAEGFGPMRIIARLSMWNLHFLDIRSEGSLYITTVFDRESRNGKLKAVHTRHEYTDVSVPGFTSKPEQYYGECEAGS